MKFDEDTEHGEADQLEESPLQKFMKLLEENMLNGWGRLKCYQWSLEMGLNRTEFDEIYDNIKRSWKLPTMTFEQFCEQRDIARARYTHIYQVCMAKGKHASALVAVEKIVRLDGLDQPQQLQILLGSTVASGHAQITNAARDRVAQLVDKMRMLAGPEPVYDEDDESKTKTNGVNGHSKPVIGSNGVIEIEGRYPKGDPRNND